MQSEGSRRARVNRNNEGQPIGCAVFLTARELQDLGFELETTDVIVYGIEDGNIRLTEPTPKEVAE